MKSIKPIALKEAKILSNEEMKLLFGGSGGDSGLTAKCNESAACTVSYGGVGYSGTCKALVTSTSVSCYCEFEIGGLKGSGSDSACLTVTPLS